MEENISIIKSVGIDEREEIIVDYALLLETASKEALVYGEGKFAMISASMVEAMRVNADEFARDNPEKTERVLQQASAMMAQFKAAYPHRAVDPSIEGRWGRLVGAWTGWGILPAKMRENEVENRLILLGMKFLRHGS